MKNKIFIFLIVTLASCAKNPIENTLMTKSGEYWVMYSTNSSYYSHYTFNKDKFSYEFGRDNSNNYFRIRGGDAIEVPKKWSVTNDSIMTWGNVKYDIVSYNANAIVVNYLLKTKPYTGYIFLTLVST
nr:hypothetical protein [uncultured Flavobacterium sp.]